MRFNDAVLGVILMALAGVMLALTFSFPPFPGQQYGPSLFPRILAGGIIVFSAILMLRSFRAGRREPWLELADWVREPRQLASFALMLGAMVFYIFASEPLGFIPTAFLIQLVMFFWFGVRPVTAITVAIVMTGVVYWFFDGLMRVPLPRGILDSVL
jgi:putative tricarboxylic transport membrane protein